MRTPSAVLTGLGGYVPSTEVTNEDLASRMDTNDEWIRTRTGIATRRFVRPGQSTGDLAVVAGKRALHSAGIASTELVILATTTPDHRCPATAPWVASQLGMESVPAFDISAVCSGFIYALAQASAFISSGQYRSVLVIGADTFSTIVDPTDRATAIIFGDGAGAVVLEAGEAGSSGEVSSFDLKSNGHDSELIQIKAGGSRFPMPPGTKSEGTFLTMQGRTVFMTAVQAMVSSSKRALERSGWRAEDVDQFVAHQANQRILHQVATAIGVPVERAVIHLDRVGNTSAASIPLALAAHAAQLMAGDRILLTAFGGGSTWGSGTILWPALDAVDPCNQTEMVSS